MLERLARDQHSSLLQTLVNYVRKKMYNIGPRLQQEKGVFKIFQKLFTILKKSRFVGNT
jgi:hypothetical protein